MDTEYAEYKSIELTDTPPSLSQTMNESELDEKMRYDQIRPILQSQMNAKDKAISGKPINIRTHLFTKYGKPQHPFGQNFAHVYTGGVIKCTHQEWRTLVEEYVKDVIAGNILAISEVCPSNIGIRLFFELDYRSHIRLPKEEEMLKHCQMMKQLVTESFPDQKFTSCKVAKCDPKLKYVQSEPNHPKLAVGLHVVFPYVIVTAWQLRQLVLTLDYRITKDNPFFAHTVDAGSVHTEYANLRPIYAYRMDPCKGCYEDRTKLYTSTHSNSHTKQKVSKQAKINLAWQKNASKNIKDDECDSDSGDEDILCQEFSTLTCNQIGCVKGRNVVSSSIYEPWLEIHETDEISFASYPQTQKELTEWILDMSIVPEPDRNELDHYKPPIDAIDIDQIHVKNPLQTLTFADSGWHQSKLQRSALKPLTPDLYGEAYKYVNDIIHQFHPTYECVLVSGLLYSKTKGSLLVKIKGNAYKACFMKAYIHQSQKMQQQPFLEINSFAPEQHDSNGIYFMIYLKTATIQTCCYDKVDCVPLYNHFYKPHKSKSRKLTTEELQFLRCIQKSIPRDLLTPLLDIFHILPKRFLDTQSPLQNCDTNSQLRERLPNGDSKPVDLVFDPRVARFVAPSFLELDINSYKRQKLTDVNPNYFLDTIPTQKKQSVDLRPIAKNSEQHSDFDLLTAFLKE
jgi:hypothetical protein